MHNQYRRYRYRTVLLIMAVLILVCISTAAVAAAGVGKTTASGVRLRKEASTNADYWFRVPINYVCNYSDTVEDPDGVTWYRVTISNPESSDPTEYTGYLHGDFFTSTTVTSSSSGNMDISGSSATARIKNGDVNMRVAPSMDAATVYRGLDAGTVVEILAIPSPSDPDPWYQVRYGGQTGYIRAMFLQVISYGSLPTDQYGNPATPSPVPTATQAGATTTAATATQPVATAVPTASFVRLTKSSAHLRVSPSGSVWTDWEEQGASLPLAGNAVSQDGYTWYPVTCGNRTLYVRGDCVEVVLSNGQTAPTPAPTKAPVLGYVRVTKSCNLRLQPSGTVITTVPRSTVLSYIATPTNSGGYTWYFVEYENTRGYVRSDCVELYGSSATPAPTATSASVNTDYGYIRVTKSGVNVRSTPSGSRLTTVNINTVWKMTGNAVTQNRYTWYPVNVNGVTGYIRGDCAYKMSAAEVTSYLNGGGGAATPTQNTTPAPTANTQTYIGYVQTTKNSVNVRATISGSVVGRIDKGEICGYTTKTTSRGYTWYLCTTSVGTGYLRSDCVKEVNSNGSNVQPTAAPTARTGSYSSPSTGQVETSYSTLREGSSGASVSNLVAELINQGYYSGSVTSSYNSSVTAAVKAFQTAKGLNADGVATESMQHALYGTKAVGGSSHSDRTMTIFPAEKIDWYTGGIQELIPRGSNFKVYDVKTGLVWWAHRWAGGKHADIEPLTAADTAILCQLYGVSKASNINSKEHWQRRPCLVTVGTRTFACSLYGVPHNPDGDTIDDNNLTGQVCLHFTNSRTHDSDRVDSYHTEAIQYAWEHAPNGNK